MGWKLVSKKKLWPTDVSARHNRVLLHRDDVRSNLLPLLPQWERNAVERGEPVTLPIRSASAGKKYRVEFAYWPSTKGYILHGRGWASFRKDVALEKMKGGVLFLLALCSDDTVDGDDGREDRRRFSSMVMDVAVDEQDMEAAEVLLSLRQPVIFT